MYFTLPDLPKICPFSPSLNPHHEAVAPESKTWINSFGILSGRQQRAFSSAGLELFAAYLYPYADQEGCRAACDFINLTTALDDYSDDQGTRGARTMADSFMNALGDPTWDDGSVFVKLAREFSGKLTAATTTALRHLIDAYDRYLGTIVTEAENRENGVILALKDFMEYRLDDCGAYVAFAVSECILGVDLQPEVFDHPTVSMLRTIGCRLSFVLNDIYSYNREQATGHGENNMITVIMKDRGIGLQEAFDVAGQIFEKDTKEFLEHKGQLPSWGSEVDDAVSRYVSAMEHVVTGSIEWCFCTPRYFGDSAVEVKKTRQVLLDERSS